MFSSLFNDSKAKSLFLFCCAILFSFIRTEVSEKKGLTSAPPLVDMNVNTPQTIDVSFTHGLISSFSAIVVSEVGDKTFFIAAIMAMQHSRLAVFLGAMTALIGMTLLSVLLGFSAQVIPRVYTFYTSSLLFLFFGAKMLYDGWHMGRDEAQQEYEEVQSDLKRREESRHQPSTPADLDLESGGGGGGGGGGGPFTTSLRRLFSTSRVFVQALSLTFVAEWGDRSQIATILLAVREHVWGVCLGASVGHFLCTGLAVLAGRLISQRISARTITLFGGVVFIIFAFSALYLKDT